MHEKLIFFKIFMKFVNFSCMMFFVKNVSIHSIYIYILLWSARSLKQDPPCDIFLGDIRNFRIFFFFVIILISQWRFKKGKNIGKLKLQLETLKTLIKGNTQINNAKKKKKKKIGKAGAT